MKSLQNKLYEGFYKNAGGMVQPSSSAELRDEIEARLDKGQYNLNDIDTSKITDMSYLFYDSDYWDGIAGILACSYLFHLAFRSRDNLVIHVAVCSIILKQHFAPKAYI